MRVASPYSSEKACLVHRDSSPKSPFGVEVPASTTSTSHWNMAPAPMTRSASSRCLRRLLVRPRSPGGMCMKTPSAGSQRERGARKAGRRDGSRDEHLYVGLVCFLISEVAEYSLAGALLPLPGGAVLQAAMASLVIHAAKRSLDDDLALLAKRIAAYEARTSPVR